ncbi:maltotransferase domain-containing protein [Antarcticibacterium sp. 1MA-6-2]|uniref:maltotransferase domain-containing protein n=1 Tax=Antarcticibacterium sp. 1MA-6-2 TaxID=2908210 RepID=UPI0021055480|nr:maltotransferase domain-containing protein [Antarcticibacterium sp. 1MA-6-2]
MKADIFTDGHEKVDAVILYREKVKGKNKEKKWNEKRLEFVINDRWRGSFQLLSNRILRIHYRGMGRPFCNLAVWFKKEI